MREKEKACPVAATTEQALIENQGMATIHSHDDSTTTVRQRQRLLDILQYGSDHAISAPQLTKLLGLGNTRALRSMISEERDRGTLILSDNRGYYLPSKDKATEQMELSRYHSKASSRVLHGFKQLSYVSKALGRLPGQVEFEMMERGAK